MSPRASTSSGWSLFSVCCNTDILDANINKVETWITQQGYRIIRVPAHGKLGFECCSNTRTIKVNPLVTKKNYLYTLLHECGHLRLDDDRSPLTSPRIRSRALARDAFGRTCGTGKLATLDEEMDAWAEGEDLAQDLNIALEPKTYQRQKTRCLMTYVRKLAR